MPTLTDEDLGLSSSTGLSDADLGLDTAVLPQAQMAEAANAVPLPGYSTSFGSDLAKTAASRRNFQPSEQALASGAFINQQTLIPPPMEESALSGLTPHGLNREAQARSNAEPPGLYRQTLIGMRQQLTPTPETVRSAREFAGTIFANPEDPEALAAAEERLAGPNLPPEAIDQAIAGGLGGTYQQLESLAQPENLPLLLTGGIGGTAGKILTGTFMADMAAHSPELYAELRDAFRSGDTQAQAQALVKGLTAAAFFASMGKHLTEGQARTSAEQFVKQATPEQKTVLLEALKPKDEIPRAEGEIGRPVPKTEEEIQRALSIRSSETLPLGKSPKDSGEVGARIPEPKASAETQSGEPSPAQPTETAPSEISLRPAIRGQGQIVEGTLGKSHGDLITDATKSGDPNKMMAAIAGANEGRGFVDQNGKFYTRKEAEALMREQHGDFEMMKPAEGLHSEDLNAQGQPKTQKAAAVEPAKVAEGVDTSNVKGKLTEEEQKTADKTLPWTDFKEPMPASPHYPIIIETKNGLRYPAYMSDFYDMREVGGKLAPGIAKVVESGPGDIGLSHGILGEGEKIVAGDYPKTPEAYQAAKAAGVKPPRTLGEIGKITPEEAKLRSPIPQVPIPEHFGSAEDVINFRNQRRNEEIDLYKKEIGLTQPEAERLQAIMEREGSTERLEKDIGPEKAAKLNDLFDGPQNQKDNPYGFRFWDYSKGFNPEDVATETDKPWIAQQLIQALQHDVHPNPESDRFLFSIIAARRLLELGGTKSDIARALDKYTTRHSGSSGDKAEFFVDSGKKINAFLQTHGIDLPQGELSRKASTDLPRTLGETPKPKSAETSALATPKAQSETPLPADVAPAYEHGHAVASNVPGLLIDPFGFQAAKIVGKAAKDLYDSPAVKKARQDVADLWNAAALKSAPKLTHSNRQLGEAGVRYASSFMVGRTKGQIFADKVLADSKIDPVKFGTALAEDNLRSIRAARDPAQAAKVRTLVGYETSPFKTEAEYQAFLNDPATKAAIERHQQLWAEQKDPIYRQANDLDPDLPLETRGMQTGARINLKALQPGETGVAPIGQRAPGFRQLATLKRRDPFGRQAKGSGLAYEGNYHEIMANGFERELPVAAQHEFLKQLIDNGDAVVTDKMVEPELELKGEGTAKGYLLTLKPYTGKFIHVRKGLADEFEAISGLDKPLKLPIITAFNNFMTRQSVAGLAEGATHASNLMTQIFTMPGPTGNPMLNALLKSVGRADLLVSVPRVFIKAFTNQRERMLDLAEIGAAKEPYPGAIAKKILNPIDQGVRLVSDDVFKALAKNGIVEGTETNRREFINQVGQYNKRLQPLLTRKLRETGLQPFITAAQTFNAQGARRLVMGPGAKAINNARALALKADVAAGWMGGIVLVTALNLLLSKKATGPVGTPLGSVGWVGDDQKVHTFNVFRLLGYERGARITGLGPYIEAKRQGLSSGQALTSGAQSVASTGLGMAMGPGPRFAMVAGTGQRPTQPWVRETPRVPPSDSLSPLKSQIAKNIQTAMVEANPILSSVAEVRKEVKQGKPLSEALVGGAQKQLTRYSPQTRMSEQKAAALPKIVDSAQLRDYVDDVVKEARQLPMRERQHFINQKFRDDELGRKYRDAAWQQIERKGVLKYK